MQRSFVFNVFASILIVACGLTVIWGAFHRHELPFSIEIEDAQIARVVPKSGMTMPVGIQGGDLIELPALDADTRMAVTIQNLQGNLPADKTYRFVVSHGSGSVIAPVTVVPNGANRLERVTLWTLCTFYAIGAALALLLIWRGRGRGADYMAVWLTLSLLGFTSSGGFPQDGIAGVVLQMAALGCYVCGRICLYLTFEYLMGAALTPRMRTSLRVLLALVLLAGSAAMFGGPLVYIIDGWAELLLPAYGVLFTSGYLFPALALLLGYGRASEAQKPQLRWLLLSLATLLVGVFLSNTRIMDAATNLVVQGMFQFLSISGFTYTVLIRRVIPVSVILDRTLVYGAITALVVGVVAALNSLALRATLGEGAGLLLQIVVPLALGIVLGKVRGYLDRIVERVFFRAKYLAEKSLRNFARQCGHIDKLPKLLAAAVAEIARQTKSPGVAFYEITAEGYACMRQQGEVHYLSRLDGNDPALVAVRADLEPVDLADYVSELGQDSCVFPITVLGVLRGVMVCANRPGEHFAADEKALLSEVARAVGAAWRILRARDNEELVAAMATGAVPPDKAFAEARRISLGWAEG